MPFHKGCCKYRDKIGNLPYRVLFSLKKKPPEKKKWISLSQRIQNMYNQILNT